jgi:hypothetical protein
MLGQEEFHNDLINRYTKLFGSLFANLEVYRENSKGKASLQKVPLMESEKDKVLEFAKQEYESDEMAVATISPRMGYSLVDFSYDPARYTGKFKTARYASGRSAPCIPYNLTFELVVVGKTKTDVQRVVEQIIPYFTPALTVTIFPIEGDTTFSRDITVSLSQLSKTDTYLGEAENRRTVTWTLVFTMQAFMFGAIDKTPDGVIKKITISYKDVDSGHTDYTAVYGGLTANNQPTTDTTKAIDYKLVKESDPFAIIQVNTHDS